MLSQRKMCQLILVTAAFVGINSAQAQSTKTLHIHDIQGPGHVSPLAGHDVNDVPGIVTAVAKSGFFMQDPTPDKDVATSEGIFVFTKDKPTVSAGDSVTVSGTVQEFRPGKNDPNTLSVTEIAGKLKVKALSSKNPLPPPVVLGQGGRTIPTKIVSRVKGDVEQ